LIDKIVNNLFQRVKNNCVLQFLVLKRSALQKKLTMSSAAIIKFYDPLHFVWVDKSLKKFFLLFNCRDLGRSVILSHSSIFSYNWYNKRIKKRLYYCFYFSNVIIRLFWILVTGKKRRGEISLLSKKESNCVSIPKLGV
jgi:hypothetical protein